MAELLDVHDLSVTLGEEPVVRSVSLAVESGQIMAVVGPSGCGKSTLLRALCGLEPVSTGRVELLGRDLAGVPTHRRGITLMFQDGQLFTHLSVAQNVAYALPRAARRASGPRVAELLALVGLDGFGDRSVTTLSGGERQRVALARAVAAEPRVLLLDEPLSALDAQLRTSLAGELRDILRAAGTTALLVTHDHEEAFAVADAIGVMRAGELVQSGPISSVWGHPADAETALFLGYASVLTGAAAAQVCAAGGRPAYVEVALRRSALVVTDGGPLSGVVGRVQASPEVTRVRVVIEGVGEVDAVAPLGKPVLPNTTVELVVDPTKLAPVGPQSSVREP